MNTAASTSVRASSTLHLEREINQQPQLWRQVARQTSERRAEIDAFLTPLLHRPEARVVLTGAGTSAFAGEVAAPALSRTLRRRVEAVATTDLVSNPWDYLTPDVPTLLVSCARSGDSPESVAAAELAEQVLTNVRHLIIICNPAGQLARAHDGRTSSLVLPLPPEANDQSFAMTSSFTCLTLTALLALSGADDATIGRVEVLAAAAEDLLSSRGRVAALADLRPSRVVYLGSGALRGLARESALKLLELTAGDVLALAESPLGFRHGPKAVLTPDTLAIVYLSNDPYTRRYDLDIVTELTTQLDPDRVVAIDGSDGSAGLEPVPLPSVARTLSLRGTGRISDGFLALPAVLVPQLLGLAISLARGHAPDNPFPTGEVNRVVQGVRLHPLAP